MDLASDQYLTLATSLTAEERTIRDEARNWLPDEILDGHAHCNLPQHVGVLPERVLRHMMSTFPSWSIEQSLAIRDLLYPGKHVRTLRFPNPYQGIDHRSANDYLLSASPPGDRVAVFGIPEDIGYTVAEISKPSAAALKMYYFYTDPPASTIYGVFPPTILEQCQTVDKPIILHLPRPVDQCYGEIKTVLRDFPRLRVVLAHLGMAKRPSDDLASAYADLAGEEGLFLDTSMARSRGVLDIVLRSFPTSRMLYGSDEPLNLIRATIYEHPILGERLATPCPYHWASKAEQDGLPCIAATAIQRHWQVLRDLRLAFSGLSNVRQDRLLESVFCTTARDLFRFD